MNVSAIRRVIGSILFCRLPVVTPIPRWENRTARVVATASILYPTILGSRMFHPLFPRYYFLFLFGVTLIALPLRTFRTLRFRHRSARAARRSLAVVAGLLKQPWPLLQWAMLIAGLLTPLVSQIPTMDALFAAQATAVLVPIFRLEMRHDLRL